MEIDNYVEINKERQEELIKMMKEAIKKETEKNNKLTELLKIIEDDTELDFMYSWLYENNITKKVINGRRIIPFSLTSEQNIEYARKMERSDIDKDTKAKIRDKMIVGNLSFASWYVKNCVSDVYKDRIGEEDLIQVAAMGIMKAVEKFDYRKGCTFTTYASCCIRSALSKEIRNQDSLYKIRADKRLAIFSKLNKAENEFEMMNGRKPSLDELADSMKMSPTEIDELKKLRLRYNVLSTEELLEKNEEDLINSSLDTDKITELENRIIIDGVYVDEQEEKDYEPVTIEYNGDNNPESLADTLELRSELANALSTLTEREQAILIKRFGLGDEKPQTLGAVSKEMCLGRTKLLNREAKAIRKLRHPSRARALRVFQDIEFSRLSEKTVKELLDEKRKKNTIDIIKDLRAKEKELDAQITAAQGKELPNKE